MSEVIILSIDASTYTGTAAIIAGGRVLAERAVAMRGEREERLMPAIAAMMEEAGVDGKSLAAVACGAGPGSFTSLRIAASIAKGLAVALGKPLLAVPSMLLVVAGADPELAPGSYAVLLDAMRGEVYAATVDLATDSPPRLVSHITIISATAAEGFAARAGAVAVGPAIAPGLFPHARGVARLIGAGGGFGSLRPVDLDAWEPDYGRLAEAQVKWEAAHGRSLPRG